MTITQVDTSVQVGAAVMDSQAVQIARDFLAGYTGEYYFFQYSRYSALNPDEYILITGTDFSIDDESGDLVTGDQFTVFDITRTFDISTVNHNYPITGTITGELVGTDPAVVNESFSGSMEVPEVQMVSQWITQVYTVDHQISLVNDGVSDAPFLVYSSFGQNPRLISGGDNYAFYISLLLSVSFCVSLFSGIFRKVRT